MPTAGQWLLKSNAQRAYGQTIIKLLEDVARPAATPGLVGILEDPNQMQVCIRRIARFRPTRRRAGFAGLTAVMLGWVRLTDAPARKPAEAPAEAQNLALTQARADVPEEADLEVRVGSDPNVRAEDALHGTMSLTVRVVNTVTGRWRVWGQISTFNIRAARPRTWQGDISRGVSRGSPRRPGFVKY